ncbi:cytidylate kinase [Streptomyces sp. V3I8]|nr:cytidylate kinase [Streptomyces sp. V3I8]
MLRPGRLRGRRSGRTREELKTQVWPSADVSRRLRAIAARTNLSPEQVLAQLAGRVRMDDARDSNDGC